MKFIQSARVSRALTTLSTQLGASKKGRGHMNLRQLLEGLEARVFLSATPVTQAVASASQIGDVFMIVMENHNWTQPADQTDPPQIKNNPLAPYINSLANQNAFASEYLNAGTNQGLDIHPSEPNYIWLESGSDNGIEDDLDPVTVTNGQVTINPGHMLNVNHLATLLDQASIPWKSYQEGISGTQVPLVSTGDYVPKHDPFVYFADSTGNGNPNDPYGIAHNRPFTELANDLTNNTVARYNFITPDLYDDMHSSLDGGDEVQQGDDWLAKNLPTILNSQAYKNNGLIIITSDETEGGDDAQHTIPLLILSPLAKSGGYTNTIEYSHSSTLKTLQEIFQVGPLLGDAANPLTNDLSDLFQPGVIPQTVPGGLTPPTAPTTLVATPGIGSIGLSWNDTATNAASYVVERSPDNFSTTVMTVATLSGTATSFADSYQITPGLTYYYRVHAVNAAGVSPAITASATLASTVNTTTLVAKGSVWSYLDNGTDPGTAWQGASFDATAWKSGPAELGYGGDPAIQTTIGYGADSTNKYVTSYFRQTFNVTDPTQISNLILSLKRDDGAVVYINGQEVLRDNMPTGTILTSTLATNAISGADESTFFTFAVSPGVLLAGTNTIAVELHQAYRASSDTMFDLGLEAVPPTAAPPVPTKLIVTRVSSSSITLGWTAPGGSDFEVERKGASDPDTAFTLVGTVINGQGNSYTDSGLSAGVLYTYRVRAVNDDGASTYTLPLTTSTQNVTTTNTTLVAQQSIWKYLDNGTDQGTAWEAPAFNDSTWASGQARLGYGGDGEVTTVSYGSDSTNKYITTYFRKTFTLGVDPSQVLSLALHLVRDDGAVIYLNGVEVVRSNMPDDVITSQTRASTTVDGIDESTFFAYVVDPKYLVAGVNTLAVEIHQAYAGSSDIGFDMDLIATLAAPTTSPTVSITATQPNAAEGGAAGQITISRTGATDQALTVTLNTSGTATSGTDYTALPATVTIAAGQSSVSFAVAAIDDNIVEGPETAVFSIGAGSTYVVDPLNSAATVTIADNDVLPTLSIIASQPNATESGTPGQFTITRTGNTTAALSAILTIGGTAISGSDYTGFVTTVSIPAGQASTTITLSPIDRGIIGGAKSVILSIAASSDYAVDATNNAATVTITDDDVAPAVVSIVATQAAATETGTKGVVTVTRTGALTSALTITFTLTGTAANGTDYTTLPLTLTIAAGQAAGTITLSPIDRNIVGGSKTAIFTLVGGTGYTVDSTKNAATVTIAENDVLPTVSIVATQATATETGTTGVVTLTRTGSLTSALVVSFTLTGTAANGTDYTTLPLTVTIAAGQATGTVTLKPIDRNIVGGSKTAIFTLAANSAYTIDSTKKAATVTIADNDVLPTVSIVATRAAATESGTTGLVTITRTGALTNAMTVSFTLTGTAANGTDYTTLPLTLTIAAGQSTGTVTLKPIDRNIVGGSKTAIFTLATNSAYTIDSTKKAATVTIAEDDVLPTVSIVATRANAAETGTTGLMTISRTGQITSALAVKVTIAGTASNGTDYTTISTTVTIAAGQSSAVVTLSPIDRGIVGGTKTAIFTLATSTAYTIDAVKKAATITLTDDDAAPVVTISATKANAVEGGSPGEFTITRTGSTAKALTVTYTVGGTATNGTDYTKVSGTVTIPIGALTVALPITPVNDTLVEAPETIVLALKTSTSYTLGATTAATVTISDNDTVIAPIHINFQPVLALTPSGYVADTGAKFATHGNLQFGWNTAVSTALRVSLKYDQQHDTNALMTATSQWSIVVPNGTYTVHVVTGDPTVTSNASYQLNVNGALAVSGTPTATNPFVESTVTVVVTNGQIMLSSGAGALNMRLAYLDITPA